MQALKSGIVALIYAGYAALWLDTWPADRGFAWLRLPWGSSLAGGIATLVVVGIALYAAVDLVKALIFGPRGTRLEGGGVQEASYRGRERQARALPPIVAFNDVPYHFVRNGKATLMLGGGPMYRVNRS